ncbi:hypothetical protein [Microtetraspora malaysiensis]|uniref:hypothetical protein n=1 Tax=Microtetraspora malaysiensis TaxID=161358 RepID=UPI000835D1D4|nr:hypothetical protein [Microtetraspora malaysiensis]
MRKSITVLTTLFLLLAMTATASASGNGWRSDSPEGSVKVSSDRKHITVCDLQDDTTEVWAEYATSFLLMHTVKAEKAGGFECGEDTVFFGYITVFKLCFRYNHAVKQCNRSIWIK